MTQSRCYRRKRNLIAGWLNDFFNDDDFPDAYYWENASDLIKFLTANGIELVCTSSCQGAAKVQEDILSHANS